MARTGANRQRGGAQARASASAQTPRAWQRMLSGRRLDLLDPSPMDIEIEDIAHGLARVARWNGQTRGDHAFSVAQHSILVENIFAHMHPRATPAERLGALLHDAPEYVIGDMISPFKNVIGSDYRQFEKRLEGAIRLRFGLTPHPAPAIAALMKRADIAAAFYEATRLAGFDVDEALVVFGPPPPGPAPDLTPFSPRMAQEQFLHRFAELIAALDGGQARKQGG